MRRLASAGIPVGVSIGPIIPFINDHEIESLLEASREAGARSAHYTVIRLPLEVSPLFEQWLQAHFPDRARRVMHRIQDMRDGKNYDARFFSRMKGEGVLANLIRMRFANTVRRLGLSRDRPDLDTNLFRRPASAADPGAEAHRPAPLRGHGGGAVPPVTPTLSPPRTSSLR